MWALRKREQKKTRIVSRLAQGSLGRENENLDKALSQGISLTVLPSSP